MRSRRPWITKRTKLGLLRAQHGDSGKYLYGCWENIRLRTLSPKCKQYKYYGARGIALYQPWQNNYAAFRDWVASNLGSRPEGLTLDRINNDGNYEPGNMRWATMKQQSNNRTKRERSQCKYGHPYPENYQYIGCKICCGVASRRYYQRKKLEGESNHA